VNLVFHSSVLTDLTPSSPRFGRHTLLGRTWRCASWILLVVCYLGAIISVAGLLSIPFQHFHRHSVSPFTFWIVTTLMGVLFLWLLLRAGSCAYRNIQQRIIHIEAFVMLLGLSSAFAVIFWIFPPK